MLNFIKERVRLRKKRAIRVRKHLVGTMAKPRLSVKRTNKHLFAQLIDDEKGETLAAVSTVSKENKGTEFGRKSKTAARKLGETIAELAKAKNVTAVVFDRGAHKYHGIVAELADGARSGGLQF